MRGQRSSSSAQHAPPAAPDSGAGISPTPQVRTVGHGPQGPQEDPILGARAPQSARPPPGGDGKGAAPHPRSALSTHPRRSPAVLLLDPAWVAARRPAGREVRWRLLATFPWSFELILGGRIQAVGVRRQSARSWDCPFGPYIAPLGSSFSHGDQVTAVAPPETHIAQASKAVISTSWSR